MTLYRELDAGAIAQNILPEVVWQRRTPCSRKKVTYCFRRVVFALLCRQAGSWLPRFASLPPCVNLGAEKLSVFVEHAARKLLQVAQGIAQNTKDAPHGAIDHLRHKLGAGAEHVQRLTFAANRSPQRKRVLASRSFDSRGSDPGRVVSFMLCWPREPASSIVQRATGVLILS